jgi:nucleoside-diphosphate-sugar epimerase
VTTTASIEHYSPTSHAFLQIDTTTMTRVLLTGGSGFIAAHTLDILLKNGHSVVTTVRTQDKADKIKEDHKNYVDKGQLSFAIVPDIAQPGAFEKAVVSDPPFEAVLHTASPFHFNVTDVQKDLLDPAIIGTTGILESIKKNAPSVKQVVITSSFAAIVNPSKGFWPGHSYSEDDWNPITVEEAHENPMTGYRASKTFAEKAAWDFVAQEKPNFSISTINPPMVYGPIVCITPLTHGLR